MVSNYFIINKCVVKNALQDLEGIAECVECGLQPTTGDKKWKNLQAEKLAFINKYIELLRALDQKNNQKAGELILVLLTGNSMTNIVPSPRRFWMVLLMHAVPLLENTQDLIFDSQQTFTLMNALEELCVSHRSDEYLKGIHSNNIQIVRLALARNLSRAFLT